MISIFIPVYNGSVYLIQTLDSLLSQHYQDFEVLCVDDSSTDASLSILKNYQSIDRRIKIFVKPNEGSVPFSWKFIIPKLQGEFTIYMSQDDLLEPDTLEKLMLRQQKTNADAVIPQVVFYHSKDHRIDSGVNGDLCVELSGKEAYRLALDYTIPGFALWRTAIVRKEGMLTDAFNSDELAQRLWLLACNKVVFSDAKFLYRQDNEQAITKAFRKNHYTSTITDLHLLQSMHKQQIEQIIVDSFKVKYFKSLLYLRAMYLKYKKTYSLEEQKEINRIHSEAYPVLSNQLMFQNPVLKLASLHPFLFNLVAWGFCIKLKL